MQIDEKPKGSKLPMYDAEVKVSDPESDPVKGFYTYLVSGKDELGTFQIRRRYNDFFYYRECLVKKWPGIYIPPIPQKKLAGNKDAENIQGRKKLFDYFLKRLGKVKHLFTHPITQQFLRNKNLDLQKFYSTLPTPKYSELVQQYQNTFQKYVNLNSTQSGDFKIKISSFGNFLKKAQTQLSGLRAQVEIIVNSRQSFTQKLNNCNAVMLPEYEKNVYAQYLPDEQKKDPSLVFVNNHKVQDTIRAFRDVAAVNSFTATLDLLTYEILQVKAMEQAYKLKEKLESTKKDKDEQMLKNQAQLAKLMGGKTTFKSIFSRGSKNQQITTLQKDIPQLQKQIKSLGQLNGMLTIIFAEIELPTFKRQKQLQYYRMMYEVSQNELKYLSSYGEFMKSVMQGVNKQN